ncbi:hypothetical protein DPMN_026672 [Dreissena polymorpha]|uniref:Uncharacterized protein n=1 Tax=Dreissena polymorpha TaxID=45954 RepID=A0A9D4LTU3_DREPO|nr:hypothetical protein DPMN_026672 [Dreissena polymorpha]
MIEYRADLGPEVRDLTDITEYRADLGPAVRDLTDITEYRADLGPAVRDLTDITDYRADLRPAVRDLTDITEYRAGLRPAVRMKDALYNIVTEFIPLGYSSYKEKVSKYISFCWNLLGKLGIIVQFITNNVLMNNVFFS